MKTYGVLTALNCIMLCVTMMVLANIALDLRKEIIFSRAQMVSATQDMRAETRGLTAACIVVDNESSGRWPRVAE